MLSNQIIEKQYKVLRYSIDMVFPVHKLGIEIDGKGHKDRPEAEEKQREGKIKKDQHYNFTIIRINPDKKIFDFNKVIGRIINYIIKSTKKLAEESTQKSITDKAEKAGFNFVNNASVSKFVKTFVRQLLLTL